MQGGFHLQEGDGFDLWLKRNLSLYSLASDATIFANREYS